MDTDLSGARRGASPARTTLALAGLCLACACGSSDEAAPPPGSASPGAASAPAPLTTDAAPSPDAAAPASPFTVDADVIRDHRTNLTWQRTPAPGTVDWRGALADCQRLRLDGRSDWRLPSYAELRRSLMDLDPPLAATLPRDTAFYWSSTPKGKTQIPLAFDYSLGYGATGEITVDDAGSMHRVRCVSGGAP